MAGYGWSMPKRPYNSPPQIACRICNHVFMSTQALIDHIESHMTEEDSAARRQLPLPPPPLMQPSPPAGLNFISCHRRANSLTQLNLSSPTHPLPFNPNAYNLPCNFQERNSSTNPMFSATPQMFSSRPTFQSPLSSMATKNSNYTMPFSLATSKKKLTMAEQASGDCTKPFLQQLEKPLTPYKNEFKGIHNNRNRSDLDMLDLTLKL
ncbi:hypothetical protein JCGZ_02348 [Jatropha curcas]|uniref:C2H2-type domain-containing protein n=1 Tax=Jatropha curcas TaxID=180498 RepID=A0A067L769_JATCU|nr:hypothetical protein JCGZ_02348 [Jatropha curcas]